MFHSITFSPVRIMLACILVAMTSACAGGQSSPEPDSAAVAQAVTDSAVARERVHVTEMLDGARSVLASLLADSATATFEELMVVQPPEVEGKIPAMVVCGKISGKPGIGGRQGPTAFIYTSRWTVFVEEAANREAFVKLWGETCGNAASVKKGEG